MIPTTVYRQALRYFVFIIIFTLVAIELLLRIFGIGDIRLESVGKDYYSYYGKKFNSWYWVNSPHLTYTDKNSDYTIEVKTNSLGHREREPEEVYATKAGIRIIALGDSFTEGMGTEQDSTYVRYLENKVRTIAPEVDFYNAGTSGSDPFFCYVLLRDKLLKYQPDIVIQTINGSDYTDFVLRGGFERFKADSTTVFHNAPWLEPFFHYCYIFRVILALNGYTGDILQKRDDFLRNCETIINPQFIALADSFLMLASRNGFKMLFVAHPAYGDFMLREAERIQQQLTTVLSAKGHCVVNIWQPMNDVMKGDNLHRYGYEQDLHFTSLGYQLMAETIFEEVEKRYPGFWKAGANFPD
ncbi:MAG TPA: GDSL-type esterase/lipase family protein [Chitinophagales bacterium]|nr:GDSL-type esterase/lipase family protein [Chitinophagales bacterium]